MCGVLEKSLWIARLKQRRQGFTLVELLVVIGIIALLISILLPALGKARQNANSAYCLSNMHNMGLALYMYMGDSRGVVPWGLGYADIANNPNLTTDWARELSHYMGAKVSTAANPVASSAGLYGYLKVFTCPDGVQGTYAYNPLQYGGNQRIFDTNNVGSLNTATDVYTSYYSQYTGPAKLSSIPMISQTALAWDGQVNVTTGTRAAINTFQDNYSAYASAVNYNDYMSLLGIHNAGVQGPYPFNVDPTYTAGLKDAKAYNVDCTIDNNYPPATNAALVDFRYRHMNNTTVNLLFGDGHCESRRIGMLLQKDFFPRCHIPKLY